MLRGVWGGQFLGHALLLPFLPELFSSDFFKVLNYVAKSSPTFARFLDGNTSEFFDRGSEFFGQGPLSKKLEQKDVII